MKRLLLTVCLMLPALSHAVEEKLYKEHGDLKIFYSAFGSSFISPEVAATNNIVRGKGKGLINIAVIKELGVGVSSKITGRLSNILQQTQVLEFVEVREQTAIYYLAPFEFDNEDFLTFRINVSPESDAGSGFGSYDFKFQKKMYHD